jgi:uncharacterized protein (DUF302 family)
MAADGLTTIRSSYGPKDTMIRLEAEVKAKGLTVFARIDHEAGAAIISGQNKLDIKIRTAAFPNIRRLRLPRASSGPTAMEG